MKRRQGILPAFVAALAERDPSDSDSLAQSPSTGSAVGDRAQIARESLLDAISAIL
jgi:hypothetical protein